MDGTRITNNPNEAADGVYTAWSKKPDFENAGCVRIAIEAEDKKWTTTRCYDVGGYVCELPPDTPERPPSTVSTTTVGALPLELSIALRCE